MISFNWVASTSGRPVRPVMSKNASISVATGIFSIFLGTVVVLKTDKGVL